MDSTEDWDVEKYRNPHESLSHWNLKKKFIELNHDHIDESRLASLAEVFLSSKILGCVYPKKTMELVNVLSEKMECNLREFKSSYHQRTLVPFTPRFVPAKSHRNKMDRKKRTTSVESSLVEEEDMEYNENTIKNTEERGHEENQVKKETDSWKEMIERLQITDDPLANFIIFQSSRIEPHIILNQSSHFNKIPVKWERTNSEEYTVIVGTTHVCTEKVPANKGGKKKIAKTALEQLKKRCYTIKVVNPVCSDFPEVEVNHDSSGTKRDYSSYGIGFKLLKQMGWKEAAEHGPKETDDKVHSYEFFPEYNQMQRNGLGKTLNKGEILDANIKKKIEEYARSDSKLDLAFSANFSLEQRKKIHKLSVKYNLKSKSSGKGEKRRIVLSRKQDSQSLLKDLVENEGQREKYELIPPLSV